MENTIEEKKNELNFEVRGLLAVIDMIDELGRIYPNYEEGTLDELKFLETHIELIREARKRLTNVFKD